MSGAKTPCATASCKQNLPWVTTYPKYCNQYCQSRWILKGSRGGVLAYISHIGTCRPRGYGFCAFWSDNGIDFAHFGLEPGMVFERTWGVYERIYPTYLFQIRKKQKYANSKWTWRIFCLHSNLSNDDIIFCLKARSENGCGKCHFLVWNRIRIWETGLAHPFQEFPGVTPRVSDLRQKKELCQGGYCWTLLCQDKRSILY